MRAHFEDYSCAMNVGESRELEHRTLSLGWEPAPSPSSADIVNVTRGR